MSTIIKPKQIGYDRDLRLSSSPRSPSPPTVEMNRLPIHHDDLTYQDRNRRAFDDMRRRMDSDMHSPFSRPWEDEFDRMCGDFYHLKPSDPLSRFKHKDGGFGSREILDDSAKSVFVEDPLTKGRRFEMSFDVKEYDPKDINVKVQNDTLLVEAKSEIEKDGQKTSSQFNRKIEIPKEVDSSRLTSTMSKDGVLTITAPVPPTYNAVASPPPAQATSAAPQFARRSPIPPSYGSLDRNSPVQQGRASPSYTQRVYITPSQAQPQRSASPRAAPTSPDGAYDNLRNGTSSPVKVIQAKPTPALEVPTFYNTERGCEMVLLVEIGKPYTPSDIKVKVDGLVISVEAEHVEKTGAKTSKSSTSRDFEIKQNIDAESVTANLKGGVLEITAMAKK